MKPTKADLERMYHTKGMTKQEIAFSFGVAPQTIKKYFEEYQIQTRPIGWRWRKGGMSGY